MGVCAMSRPGVVALLMFLPFREDTLLGGCGEPERELPVLRFRIVEAAEKALTRSANLGGELGESTRTFGGDRGGLNDSIDTGL